MKKLIIGLTLLVSGLASAQTKGSAKANEVDVYVTYITGTQAKIVIPATGQTIFLGQSFDNAGKGTWYISSDPDLIAKANEITQAGDTAVLTGAELPPFQTFTPKQWKAMKKAMKRAFPQEAHIKLSEVKWVSLTSVTKYVAPAKPTIVRPSTGGTGTGNLPR